MFQFFVQAHCNPVKITLKVQERVIWNLWIWGKYFSAHFSIISYWNRCQICCGCSSQNYEFGGSISPSYLSYFWRMKHLINQRFICGVFFELLHKNHQHSDTFAAFSTFIPHICHIHFATREFWRVFFLFYSGVEQLKYLLNPLWLNVSVFILAILLLLKQIPLAVVIVAIFFLKWDPSLSDGLHAPACLRWKSNVWTYLIFVISFTLAGFLKTKFFTKKKRLKAPKTLKMSLKK